jgi:hypothetical protein
VRVPAVAVPAAAIGVSLVLAALAGSATAAPRAPVPRAPNGPPLVLDPARPAGTAGGIGEGALEGDASASAPTSGGDPLVENGLGSPLCGRGAGELSQTSQSNCRTSGFEAAAAPTGDYALDVHIDTAAFSLNGQALLQDYAIEPLWMGLVWVVHTLIVALEWCFTLDLLDSSATSGVGRALRETQAAFTGPWLVLALALASLLAAYNGLIRRRVAETLGQAVLMLAMMAGGLWVIANPTGTVGALGQWADEASLGTLGAVAQGTPGRGPRTLADNMEALFAGVVTGPWCYLEFGNVRWCEDPARLDPRLRAAGRAIAGLERLLGGCRSGRLPELPCRLLRSDQPQMLAQSETLLLGARTNGQLFLALPADQAARNSIDQAGSLLSVLCGGGEDATDCRGPTAPEAEFRTQSGTGSRLGGLLLIAIGALGMILLFGFIALHLLGAEILSLFYLLLAPAAVLAPALGDGGRSAFRLWGSRLLGAIVSKLIYSFLLGALLLLTRTLLDLQALGWWTRWLLASALWWGAFRHRHQALGVVGGEHRAQHDRSQAGRRRAIARRVKEALETPATTWRTAQRVRHRLSGPDGRAPIPERRQAQARIGRERARAAADAQAARLLAHEHGDASARVASAAAIHTELSSKRAQLQRVQAAQGAAAAVADTRRSARLAVRARRVESEIARSQRQLSAARRTAADGDRARRRTGAGRTGAVYTRAQVQERGRFLDAQAALPAGVSRRGDAAGDRSRIGRRDYAALAGLAGYGGAQYERLDPRRRREARLEIDRELALRRELGSAAGDVAAGVQRSPGGRERRRAGRDFDRALGQRLREGGQLPPRSHAGERAASEQWPHDGRARAAGRSPIGRESPVMRDAHEVAQRRKRQLGR